MKIEIENLKQLIYGRELTAYQKALAMNEWSKLQQYVNDLEKLNIPAVINQVCEHPSSERIKLEGGNEQCGKCWQYIE